MKISYIIIFGSLTLAILLTVFAETTSPRRLKTGSFFTMAAFICCYGVCVGVAALLVDYFFHIREWVSIAIGVPLGIPVLIAAAKMS